MSKINLFQDSSEPWIIDQDYEIWTLGRKATISVTGESAINVVAGITDNLVKLRGDIDAKGAGSEGVHIEGDSTRVQVRASSLIEARDGIYNQSLGSRVENSGTIDAKDRGIASDSAMDIANRGTISADNAVSLLGDSTVTNYAGGLIEGEAVGIRISTFGSAQIVNHGKIIADEAAIIINSAGSSELRNHGKIVGDVIFGSGHDKIDTGEGKISGMVTGGKGNDDYTIGKGKFDLSENEDGGYDTVFADVSHKLRANFEELELTGTKSIDGIGNGSGNMLYGSAADNVLRGKGGHDYLAGGAGDDVLIGGSSPDYFIFEDGDGRDTVADFDVELDSLVILLDGFNSFDEIAPLISQHGDDAWISFGGGDRIILSNVDADEVTEDVILFNIPM